MYVYLHESGLLQGAREAVQHPPVPLAVLQRQTLLHLLDFDSDTDREGQAEVSACTCRRTLLHVA